MAQKNTTIKLLLFLSDQHWRRVDSRTLKLLWPKLSLGGRRSLINYGLQKGWWQRQLLENRRHLAITQMGRELLSSYLPVFDEKAGSWQGQWSLLLFLRPPKFDRQFRYLRQLLISNRAQAVSRGVYLLPSFLLERVFYDIKNNYQSHIFVWRLADCLIGDQKQFVFNNYSLLDLYESYSGISKEIERMLNKKKNFYDASDQQKKYFFSVFDRLINLLFNDAGILSFYFPKLKNGKEILFAWLQLFPTID